MASKLSEIALSEIGDHQHRALMRLILFVMGETHRQLLGVQDWLVALIREGADADGTANGTALLQAIPAAEAKWRLAMTGWRALLEAGREQAAGMAFGLLVVQHNHFVGALAVDESYRSYRSYRLSEDMTADEAGAIVQGWQRRRQLALEVANQRVYSDRLNLSQRIWRLEQEGLATIRNTLSSSMAERTNAWDLARQLEGQLGADRDLPRWTRQRLYGLDATQRAGDRKGLLQGAESRGRGVAYNALRLARTELQYANHAVTTEIARHAPWVTGRKVVLSPTHPKIDICDGYAAGGPYPKGDEILPLHPNCLCRYEDVVMDGDAFAQQARGWLAGENQFLDDYQSWLGSRRITEPLPWSLGLADSLELWLSNSQGAQAAALNLRSQE